MDNIIIVGLLTVSAVVAVVLVFETITPSLGISGQSVAHAQRDVATRMQTDIEIISVMPNLDPVPPAPATPVCAGGTVGCVVDAWTKNTGGADVSSLGNIDVILRRTDGRWGSRIPYSSNCPSAFTIANTWHRFPCARDRWPAGDILPIRLNLLADPLTPGIYKISITTPNGVTDDHIFEFSP